MRPASPAGIAARARNIAGRLESRVGDAGTILPIIEQNKPQIFEQFKKI
jgi:hypothetical protein